MVGPTPIIEADRVDLSFSFLFLMGTVDLYCTQKNKKINNWNKTKPPHGLVNCFFFFLKKRVDPESKKLVIYLT